jgi:hypothetical protein
MNVGISESAVGSIIGRPQFKAAMAAATSQVIAHGGKIATRLMELAEPALERVAYLMDNAKNEGIQMRSAFDILDRAGYKPVERVETNNTNRTLSFNLHALSDTDRAALRDLALKAARANVLGSTINAGPDVDKEVEL